MMRPALIVIDYHVFGRAGVLEYATEQVFKNAEANKKQFGEHHSRRCIIRSETRWGMMLTTGSKLPCSPQRSRWTEWSARSNRWPRRSKRPSEGS
eukprot:COSAG01_NODE_533_length_15816_cov_4.518738_11_plen_95_part_00